jgi:transposase
MPVQNFLKLETKEILQRVLKEHEHPDIRERALIFLLLNDGRTQAQVAQIIGCSVRKVAHWGVHGDPDNLDSFRDKRMDGNHRKATQEYIDLLLEVVEKEPQDYGYDFGRWTGERLATYLEEVTTIKLSGVQVMRILNGKKYVYLWPKYSLEDKQDPVKRAAFKVKLEEYLRISKENANKLQVWFWDESGFSLRVIRRKVITRKGSRKSVRGDRRKGRVNVMGGIRYSDKKRLVDLLPKGNSQNFYAVLRGFYQEVKIEWAGDDKNIDDFEKDGPEILIILDNASIHKKKEILEKIQQEMPNIKLEFLPEYSPDYNLIELVWHSAKEYVANRLFKSIEELEELLNRLLNEGELVINWGRKLKNKGESVNAI